ncbi:MAG TPA: radical SAM protein, partial [Eubacteriaceae bacterium]|nr:radical SAM protein [Eubacteriaceae bacterium]
NSPLRPFTEEESDQTINIIEEIQEEMQSVHQTRFVFPSDEFFLKAKRAIPDAAYYEDFIQLENGVGMLSKFQQQALQEIEQMPKDLSIGEVSVITGKAAGPMIEQIIHQCKKKLPNRTVHLHVIENDFFGRTITVSGLLTAKDIIQQVQKEKRAKTVLIPENMLKHPEEIFLDDVTRTQLQ